MVVRLIGEVNGQEVIFQRVLGDTWEAQVPSSLDGTYVIGMTAYDEAGNEAYFARYILTVDLSSLCTHLYKNPYQAEILKEWSADIVPEEYYAEVLKGVERNIR